MNPKWLVFLITAWIALALLGGIIDGAFIGTGAGTEEAVLNTLMSFKVFSGVEVFGLFTLPLPNLEFFGALIHLFTFDLAMFQGSTEIYRWLIFLPIAIAVGISFMLALFRGVGGG